MAEYLENANISHCLTTVIILVYIIHLLGRHHLISFYNNWNIIKQVFFGFCLFRATLMAYGGSQARGPIGASLHHATAMPDLIHVCNLHHSSRQRQILNLLSEARDQTHNLMVVGFLSDVPRRELLIKQFLLFFLFWPSEVPGARD